MDDIIHGRYRRWGKEAEQITQWQFSPRLQMLRTEVLLYLWSGLFFVLSNFCTHVEIVVKSMPKRRKSSKQLEKDREENRERNSEFCKKKTEEQALKDSLARP